MGNDELMERKCDAMQKWSQLSIGNPTNMQSEMISRYEMQFFFRGIFVVSC